MTVKKSSSARKNLIKKNLARILRIMTTLTPTQKDFYMLVGYQRIKV